MYELLTYLKIASKEFALTCKLEYCVTNYLPATAGFPSTGCVTQPV